MAIAFVQSAKTPDGTTTATATFDAPPTEGHFLAGVVLSQTNNDSAGADGVLTLAGWNIRGPYGTGANNRLQNVWFVDKVAGAAESDTVTGTIAIGGAPDTGGFLVVAEYDPDGAALGVSVLETGVLSGPADSATFPALIPATGVPALIIIALAHEPNYTASVSDGWTIREETNVGGTRQCIALVDQIVASASGAYTGTASVTGLSESHWLLPAIAYGGTPEPGIWVDWDND